MGKKFNGHSVDDFTVSPGAHFKPKKWPTYLRPLFDTKSDADQALTDLKQVLNEREDIMYADARHGVIIVFQGVDAAGKDSAIKHVISNFNPQGTSVVSFSSPSDEESRHDFLWRVHAKMPRRGQVAVFNRSYYEEGLTVRIHAEWIDRQRLPKSAPCGRKFWKQRFDDINWFELYLHHQGFEVVKFFLHLSKGEQQVRLLKRLERPEKNWKFDPRDLTDRQKWAELQAAYADCLAQTSTAHAPWYVIPADDKMTAHLLISWILGQRLQALPLEWPKPSSAKKKEFAAAARRLRKKD